MPEFRAPLSLDLILNILSVLDGFLVHTRLPACLLAYLGYTLVTQPMLQLRPNCTELRSMDLFNQILCRFQKYKRKVPPPSLPPLEKKNCRFLWKHFFFSRNLFFPSSKQKLFSFLHIGNKFIFSERSKTFFQFFFIIFVYPGT